MASWGGGRRWLESGLGVGGEGDGGGDASLNVTAVEGVALKISVRVLHAWQLHPVLVHAPADATFAAAGRLALLSLVESFAVTVGQVHGPGHHAWAGFELLQDASMCLRQGPCSDSCLISGGRQSGVGSVLSSTHELGLGQLLPAVLLHGLGLQLRDASVLGPEDLGE